MVDFIYFRCNRCELDGVFEDGFEPLSSGESACKNCGSRRWQMHSTSLTKIEVFKARLAGKKGRWWHGHIKERIA